MLWKATVMFVRQKRRQPASRARSTSKAAAKANRPRLPRVSAEGLEQRHFDLIGLALLAFSLYFALILYLGWDGGVAGSAAADGLRFLFGRVAYVAPFVLAASGVALIFKPMMPARRPLRTGTVCIIVGLLLALAAETAGFGGGESRTEDFNSTWMSDHGGLVGETLYWVTATLFQRVGSHIIAVLLILAGTLLLTGATISTLISTTGQAAKRTRDERIRGARGSQAKQPAPAAKKIAVAEPADVAEDETVDIFGGDKTKILPNPLDDYPEDDDTEATVRLGDTESAVGGSLTAEPAATPAPKPEGSGGEAEQSSEYVDGEAEQPSANVDGEAEQPSANDAGEAEQLALTPMGKVRGVTVSDEVDYRHPPTKSLERSRKESGPDAADHEAVARKLVETLGHFGVEAKVIGIVSGPHVSRYELRLAPGIKVKKVSELANDLAYALASTDIRILAPIPGKQAVGVEVPNARRRMVRLGDIYESRPAKASPLAVWLGRGIDGKPVWTDLAKMPHVLVAGTTGSGKSGCINAMLSSILMHADPNEVRLVLVDPKQVELNHYEHVPHLLTPVVTSPRLAANVLANLIAEMESRYGIMSQARCRNLDELNRSRKKAGEPPLPHILCVIDELADLMMVSPAEVEDSIIRLAQKSRATGIHLVLATQRPSTDIITGTIKVNIPARIAFAVSSQTDSRVILDQGGAEALLGQGDMLFRGAGSSKLDRIQGAFITEDEIAKITDHWAEQGEPEFEQELLEAKPESEDSAGGEGEFDPDQDDLLEQAVRLVIETDTASVSMIQRRLRVGYTRAGRLIDMLERRGVISGYEGSKPRQVLVSQADIPRILGWGGGKGSVDSNEDADQPDEAATAKLEV